MSPWGTRAYFEPAKRLGGSPRSLHPEHFPMVISSFCTKLLCLHGKQGHILRLEFFLEVLLGPCNLSTFQWLFLVFVPNYYVSMGNKDIFWGILLRGTPRSLQLEHLSMVISSFCAKLLCLHGKQGHTLKPANILKVLLGPCNLSTFQCLFRIFVPNYYVRNAMQRKALVIFSQHHVVTLASSCEFELCQFFFEDTSRWDLIVMGPNKNRQKANWGVFLSYTSHAD